MFSNLKNKKTVIYSCLVASPVLALAKTVTLVPTMTVDNVLVAHKQTSTNSANGASNIDTSINANTLNLGLGAHWLTNKADIKTYINTEFINRTHISGSPEEDLDAFLQLNTSANFNLWQDKLFLVTELNRTQQASTQQINIDNKLVGGTRWFNVNNGRVALDYQSRVTPQANLTTQISANKTQADSKAISIFDDARRIDIETTSGQFQLDNLDKTQPLIWSIATNYGKTKRAQFSDIKTGAINLLTSFNLTKELALTASAEQSINQVEGNSSLSNQLEYEQVGAGIRWTTSKESEFEITVYNASSERDPNEIYVGGKILLNLSQFSQLEFEKKKNALGQSDSFSLFLQGKVFNLSLNYQQSIDINVRQGLSIASPESFICPFTSQSINDCIINTDTNVSNNSDFFATTLSPQTFELNEQVVDNESLVFKLGYDNQRKIKLNLTAERTKQVGLEFFNQNRDSFSISGQLLYRLSRNSQITLNASTNATELNNQLDEQSVIELTYSRDLGRRTTWQAFAKQTDITSEQRGYEIEEVQVGANISFDFE